MAGPFSFLLIFSLEYFLSLAIVHSVKGGATMMLRMPENVEELEEIWKDTEPERERPFVISLETKVIIVMIYVAIGIAMGILYYKALHS